MVMRLTLFFTVWDKGYLVFSLFYKLRGLREEKMDKFIANEKYIAIRTLHKLIRKTLAPIQELRLGLHEFPYWKVFSSSLFP